MECSHKKKEKTEAQRTAPHELLSKRKNAQKNLIITNYDVRKLLTVDAFLDPEKIEDCITERKPIDPMGYEKKISRVIAMDQRCQKSPEEEHAGY